LVKYHYWPKYGLNINLGIIYLRVLPYVFLAFMIDFLLMYSKFDHCQCCLKMFHVWLQVVILLNNIVTFARYRYIYIYICTNALQIYNNPYQDQSSTLASASINMPPLGSNLQSEIQKILVSPRHPKLTICFSGIALSRT